MNVYFSTFILVSILLMLHSNRRMPVISKKLILCVVAATLLFVAGFRHYVGTDYAQYVQNYPRYRNGELELLSQPALIIVARICKYVYDDYGAWFFLMSAITILPIMRTIAKESQCIWLSVILYLFLGCWHFPLNIVKQGAAASILFAGYSFLRDRSFAKWVLACLIAAMFHITALLMIPVYFLVDAKISRKRTLLIILTGIAVWFSYDVLLEIVGTLKQGISVISENSKTFTNSVSLLRIMVHCIPVLLYFVFTRRYDKSDPHFCCLFNMSLLNAVLNVASMSSIYLNRFCSYTNIFNILFIPMLFQPIKRKRSTFWIMPVALVLYFVFWLYDLYKGSATVMFYWIFDR